MQTKKAVWLFPFLILMGLACALNPAQSAGRIDGIGRFFVTATPTPTPPPEDLTPFYQTMKPEFSGDIDQLLAQGITRYQLELFLPPESLNPPAAPELIVGGQVAIGMHSLHDLLRADGDAARADVPGLLEHMDIEQLRRMTPGVNVQVNPGEGR